MIDLVAERRNRLIDCAKILLVVLFTTAPLVKGYMRDSPLDLTIVVVFLLLGLAVVSALRGQISISDLVGDEFSIYLSILLAWLGLSILWSPNPNLALEVWVRFAALTASGAVFAKLIFKTRDHLDFFLRAYVVSIVVFFLLTTVVITYSVMTDVEMTINSLLIPDEEGNYLVNRISAGIAASGALLTLMMFPKLFRRSLYIPFSLFLLLCLLMMNSKGPVVSFLIGASASFLLYRRISWKRFLINGFGVLAFIGLVLPIVPPAFYWRYIDFFMRDVDKIGEYDRVVRALSLFDGGILKMIFGNGLFGYGYNILYRDQMIPEATPSIYEAHPHNIFLDIFAHGGLLAVGLFVLMMIACFQKPWAHRKKDDHALLIGFVSLGVLLAYQTSGSIISLRFLFVLLGAMTVSSKMVSDRTV